MNGAKQERHDQYTLGIARGLEDAEKGRSFTLPPCSASFEQGYRIGYESIAEEAKMTSATPKPRAGEHVTFGYWPNVGYVTFLESAKTEHGTIDWESVIGVFASAEEAEAAADSGR